MASRCSRSTHRATRAKVILLMPRNACLQLVLLLGLVPATLPAQSDPKQLQPILAKAIIEPGVVEHQIKTYMAARIPALPSPRTPEEWTAEAERIRRHVLEDVVFHGWPGDWIHSGLRWEEAGAIEGGRGYRMRKLRYEIVPGLWASAILYEPAHLSGKVPAILNLNGHVGAAGKAVEYKQKRCINYALRGMLALNAEWIGCGELAQLGNGHDFGAQLDLVGANAAGLFYLVMRKGLDYLEQHPNADRARLGVTGLSGGGWQTIVLSALDPRVAVAVPVAGYGSLASNIVHPRDTSQIEEDATDLRAGQDYTHLTAMRAPRPTYLIYNAEDNCCFRAPMVKDDLYGAVKPFFALYGKPEALAWHENLDPGTHNYQLENRLQSYRFFADHFRLPAPDGEIQVGGEIKSGAELRVGLPPDNLTMLDLARRFAAGIRRQALPSAEARVRLKSVVRYRPVSVTRAWMVDSTKNHEVETRTYEIGFSDGLGAAAVWAKPIHAPSEAPVTVVLNDRGKEAVAAEVSGRLNRGEQVLALDVLFTGDARPRKPSPTDYALLLASMGDRPIGMEAAQLLAVVHWLLVRSGVPRARLEATGMRSQLAALISAAIEPELFSEISVREGMRSLGYLLDLPVRYRSAPDLFCLDLYKEFDVDLLASLAVPLRVTQGYGPSSAARPEPLQR